MCSLYNLCRIALLGCVLGLVFSGLHVRLCTVWSYYCVERRRSKAGSCIIVCLVSVACQDDWIASRMKNSAKLQLQLFTQTNESSRHLTQYRCYFRRDISYVVGDSSARSRWRLRRPQPGCRRRWLDAPTSFALGRHDRRAAGKACRRAAQGGGGAFLLQSAATAESSLGRCSWMPFINEAPASSKDPNPERD